MTDLAAKLADVETGQTVVFTGYPEGDESKWQVKEASQAGTGGNQSRAIILRPPGISEQWLTLALKRQGKNWTIVDLAALEGKPPSGGADDAVSIDPTGVDILRVER